MLKLIYHITGALGRFDRWFTENFGWFFTNGMKEDTARKADVERV